MGTSSKLPNKKEVRVPPRKTARCPVCNQTVALDQLKNHIGSSNCR